LNVIIDDYSNILNVTDALVYLKLAFFYEDFATKDWPDASEHSQRCYEYYLDKVDPGDTGVLTRLGNLLVREHKYEAAIEVYSRILSYDSSLENVWFNKAHAQISAGDTAGAAESLRKTLELDPTITAARHMLKALSDDEAVAVSKPDDEYVKDLFDQYATVYDTHVKKLLYSATRVIRQELAKVYRNKYGIFDGRYVSPSALEEPSVDTGAGSALSAAPAGACLDREGELMDTPVEFKEAATPVGSSCSTYTSFMNGSLDILDIGCGTGLAGAWLKDYARTLVGVDLSEEMVKVAAKKQLYQELHVQPLNEYLKAADKTFDLVVAADVLSYVGDLTETFQQVAKVLRPGGHFAFTVETAPADLYLSERGYRLMRNGCFGYSKKYIDDIVAGLEPKFIIPL
jgi:predicted TPR repeat methyltransferase